jgi:hypothetical protein
MPAGNKNMALSFQDKIRPVNGATATPVSFASKVRTTTPVVETPPAQNNFLQTFAQNVLVRPAIRAGQAIGALGVKAVEQFQSPEQRAKTEAGLQAALSQDVKTPFFGTTPAQKPFGEGGGQQLFTETGKSALDIATVSYGSALNALTRSLTGKAITAAIPKIVESRGGSLLANYATKAVGNIAEIGGYTAASNILEGKPVTENLKSATAMAVGIPIVGDLFTKIVPTVYKLLARTFAQTPAKAIEMFAANPVLGKAALNRAITDETMIFKIADTAQTAIDNIQKIKTAKFTKGLAKNNVAETVLSKSNLFNKFQEVLEGHGLIKNGRSQISQALPNTTEISTMNNIIKRVNNQKSFTIKDLLVLKQFLQGQYGGNSGKFDLIVKDLAHVITDEMPKSVKALLKQSSGFENLLLAMKKELGIARGAGSGVTLDTEEGNLVIRENTQRVINALKKALQEKSDIGPLLLQQMEKIAGKQIMFDIAAQFFKSNLPPQGLQSFLGLGGGSVLAAGAAFANPSTIFVTAPTALFAGSPRVVGKMSIWGGKAAQALKELPLPFGTTANIFKGKK